MTSRTVTLGLTGLACSALVCAGCSESSSRGGGTLASGTGAITSSQVIAAAVSGQLPGVPGLSGLADLARMDGPKVDIVSPARGAVLPAGAVTLEAVVTPNSAGLAQVQVQGQTVQPDAQGVVRATLQLPPGLHTLVVEAWDNAQRRSERHVSVLVGDLAPEADALADTSSFRLTDDALDLLEPGIDQGIEAQRAALTQQVLSANMGKDTKVLGFTYGQAKAYIDSVPGGLAFAIDVPDVALEFEVKVKFLLVFSTTKRGTIRVQNLRVSGLAQIGVDANGNLTSQVTNVTSQLSGFTVPSFASDYRDRIRDAFVQGFSTQGAQQLDAAFKQALAAAPTAGTVHQTLLGQSFRTDYRLSRLAFDDWGVTAVFSGNVVADNPTAGTLDRSLVLRTPISDLVGGGQGWSAAVAVHQDAMNRALHAAWRAGALEMDLDASAFARLGVAGPSSSNLISQAPGLAALIPANLPIGMRISGQLPPVVKVRPGAQQLLDVSLGTLKVTSTLRDPNSGNSISLGEAVYAVDVPVSVVAQAGQLKLVPAGAPRIRVDLVGQALPGTEALLTQVADSLGGPLVLAALSNSTGLPLPAVNGYRVDGLQLMAHQDSLVGAGVLAPAPAGGTP